MLGPFEEVVGLTAAFRFHCGKRRSWGFEPFWFSVLEDERDACTKVIAARIWHKSLNDKNMFGFKGSKP